MDLSPKMSKLPKAVHCMLYWNFCLIRTCCLVITEENSKSLSSNLRFILLARQFGAVNTSKPSQMCHIMVHCRNYLRKHWHTIHFFFKKTMVNMIMVWIMEKMVIIPWSCHESWQPCQETWLPCRHHGMIMARSCHGSHVFPTEAGTSSSSNEINFSQAIIVNFFRAGGLNELKSQIREFKGQCYLYPVLGVLVLFPRKFFDFWHFLSRSWQCSQEIVKVFKIVVRNLRKFLKFLATKARITKISEKETGKSCIIVMQDLQISYKQLSLKTQKRGYCCMCFYLNLNLARPKRMK